MNIPKANRSAHVLTMHGDARQDDYYWLGDKENPEVIQYLEEENQYYAGMMRPLEPFRDALFNEMVARIPDVEINVPVQHGGFFYYARMAKDLQYPIYARKRADHRDALAAAPECVLLNVNQLADDGGYLSVTGQRVSPDHSKLAYLENRDGTDQYTLFIKDIERDELLPDQVENIFIDESLEWDATGKYVFYITVDECQRPYQLWRHAVGGVEQDTLLYEEADNTYTLSLSKTRSGRFILAQSSNKATTEVRFLDAQQPVQTLQLFDARQSGTEYHLEHWGDDFLLLTNDHSKNFRLLRCPIADTSLARREEMFPYDAKRFLQDVYPFQGALVLAGREDGLTELWTFESGQLSKLAWDEPLYTVSLSNNLSYETDEVLIRYESMLTPKSTFSLSLSSGERSCLQVADIPGVYQAADYRQERLWATAKDGTKVPMAVVYKASTLQHGPAPLILDAYGSYGINSDPHFDALRLPILDRGVVYVTAQIRGGSEMGYSWYEDGKWLNKRNTFTDFIAVAEDLFARGYTTPQNIAARGGSAGGLLMGAVANMAPDLFQVIAASVPFVDVVTTMLDTSIPLTTLEFDEWGNPADKVFYDYMKSYSPYDNVEAKDYPHMLVTTGLNDPRVAYWEPAKWVARLREVKTDSNTLLLKINMGAGHFGASGRFNHLKEVAESYAFVLAKIGVTMA